MTGTQEMELKLNQKIDKFINENKDYPCLLGFRYHIMHNMALTSVYQYIAYVNSFLRFTGKQPEYLKLSDYDIYLASIATKSKSYRITTYSALKKFSMYLKANGTNDANPMQYIERPKKKRYEENSVEALEKRNKGFLNKREITKMKTNVRDGIGSLRAQKFQEKTKERDMAILAVFLSTGMRCSALCRLDIDNVDMENRSLIIKDKGGCPKTVVLADNAWDILVSWINVRETRYPDQSALFVSRRRGRLTYSGVRQLIEKYADNIKDKHITPHKLRATFATQLYNSTGDVYFVQKCMDHASPSTTQLYIRGNNNESKKA